MDLKPATLKFYLLVLIEATIINLCFKYFSPEILANTEFDANQTYLSGWLTLVLFVAIVMEIWSFYYIPLENKTAKTIYYYLAWIPRGLLFLELFRIIMFSLISMESFKQNGLWWSLLIFFIVFVKEVIVLLLLTGFIEDFSKKKIKLPQNKRFFVARILCLPLFVIWLVLSKPLLNNAPDRFVFWGLYLVFIYLPLYFQWIVMNIKNRKLTLFNLIYFLGEPVFLYMIDDN